MSQKDLVETRLVICKRCRGTGVIACFSCSGRGTVITVSYGFSTSSSLCLSCYGTGIKRPCETCGGKGYSAERRSGS
jgi:DnaJ-class molecular chaperone